MAEKKHKVSPSSINQFFQCPFKWKLLHLDKVQRIVVKNEKRDLGTNIHEIIASYYKYIGNNPTPEKIEKTARSALATGFEPTLKKFEKQAGEMIENFIEFEKSRLNNYVRPRVIEKNLETGDFKGIIDYFDGKNVIDWKTGALMQIDENQMRQGKIYEILLRENGLIKDGQKVNISFVTLKNGRVLTLPLVTEAWLMEQKKRMDRIIKSGRFSRIRSGLCNWCECQVICEFAGEKLWDKAQLIKV